MSSTEKVDLVESVRETYGLEAALAALELPRSTWYYHQRDKISYKEKYIHLQPLLEEIARRHPEYGTPRVTVELRKEYGQKVNHKVVQRLLKYWDLALIRSTRPPQPSPIQKVILEAGQKANLVRQMDQIGLFEVAYTDFTELIYADGMQKAQLMPIIGHDCKVVYGWAVGKSANTKLALQAWEKAKTTFNRLDIPWEGMIVHHDQDPVYTGYGWTGKLIIKDKARLSYALNGARDNPEMESFNGHFKSENRSLFLDSQTMSELIAVVAERMDYFNAERRHSSLDYVPPLAYLKGRHSFQ